MEVVPYKDSPHEANRIAAALLRGAVGRCAQAADSPALGTLLRLVASDKVCPLLLHVEEEEVRPRR